MRLIDADKLIKEGWVLERHGVSNELLTIMSIADVPTAVPTAFDIDEIIKKLNFLYSLYESTYKDEDYPKETINIAWGRMCGIKKAIEIIKGGTE